jgi:hypothetical protein
MPLTYATTLNKLWYLFVRTPCSSSGGGGAVVGGAVGGVDVGGWRPVAPASRPPCASRGEEDMTIDSLEIDVRVGAGTSSSVEVVVVGVGVSGIGVGVGGSEAERSAAVASDAMDAVDIIDARCGCDARSAAFSCPLGTWRRAT